MAASKGIVTSLLEMRLFSNGPNPDEKLGEEAEKFVKQVDLARGKGIPREKALGIIDELTRKSGGNR